MLSLGKMTRTFGTFGVVGVVTSTRRGAQYLLACFCKSAFISIGLHTNYETLKHFRMFIQACHGVLFAPGILGSMSMVYAEPCRMMTFK